MKRLVVVHCEPYQLGSNKGSNKEPRNNPREMEYNNNKSNKHHINDSDGVCIDSDFIHTTPLSTHDNEIKISLNDKEDQELIMGKQ